VEVAERLAAPDHRPEQAMGVAAAKLLALLAVPLMGGSWLVAGSGGAAGAAAGVLLVVVLFGVTGLLLAPLKRVHPSVVVGVSLAGVGLRLAGYGAALAVLARFDGLHRPSLAMATAVAFTATLAYEIRVISTTPEFFWVRAAPPTSAATRSDL